MAPRSVTWTSEMIAELRTLRADGWSLYRCAERIGVAYSTAVFKARELGIAARLPRRTSGDQPAKGPCATVSKVVFRR
jgi:hypothetical protein